MFNIINCFNRELADARVSAHWVTIVGVEVDDKNRDAFIVVSWGYLYKIYVDDLLNANSINTFVTFEL
ncbi:MAG: hypothetical protein MJ172_08685 [Clostridia bacterium]|nr:hypothetical protein [Clostridia bacterium]